jgi:hypothetical protein
VNLDDLNLYGLFQENQPPFKASFTSKQSTSQKSNAKLDKTPDDNLSEGKAI